MECRKHWTCDNPSDLLRNEAFVEWQEGQASAVSQTGTASIASLRWRRCSICAASNHWKIPSSRQSERSSEFDVTYLRPGLIRLVHVSTLSSCLVLPPLAGAEIDRVEELLNLRIARTSLISSGTSRWCHAWPARCTSRPIICCRRGIKTPSLASSIFPTMDMVVCKRLDDFHDPITTEVRKGTGRNASNRESASQSPRGRLKD